MARRLENLPEQLVIPAGESSVESEAIMMIKSTEPLPMQIEAHVSAMIPQAVIRCGQIKSLFTE